MAGRKTSQRFFPYRRPACATVTEVKEEQVCNREGVTVREDEKHEDSRDDPKDDIKNNNNAESKLPTR